MTSRFASLPAAQSIDVFRVLRQFIADDHPQKTNLIIGVYRNPDGSAHVMRSVQKAKQLVLKEPHYDHEYVPFPGHDGFRTAATQLLLDNEPERAGLSVTSIQSVGGGGAVRLGAELCAKVLGSNIVFCPEPTYGNHELLLRGGGFEEVRKYRYWDAVSQTVDFEGLLEDLEAAPSRSVVMLHGCAHNPTGADLMAEQWDRLASLMRTRELLPFFDVAFQGLCSGDLDRDVFSVRHFVRLGFELLCAQNFSKNFGLYSERVGNLVIVSKERRALCNVVSQVSSFVASNYSMPSAFGALVVHKVLTDLTLREEWTRELDEILERITTLKCLLATKLEERNQGLKFSFLRENKGMFCVLGLSLSQIVELRDKYHVYVPGSGRLSFAGLNLSNIDHVATAISEVIK